MGKGGAKEKGVRCRRNREEMGQQGVQKSCHTVLIIAMER